MNQSNVASSSQQLYIRCNVCLQALLDQQDTGALQGVGRSKEEDGDSMQWYRVAQLLGSKYDRIDPVQALPLLPLQVNCRPFFAMPLPQPHLVSVS